MGEIKNIDQYNNLIQNLNPSGKYQKTMFAINLVIWGLAGFLQNLFDLHFSQFQCPYARATFEFMGILGAGYVASYYNRQVTMVLLGIVSLSGTCLCLVTSMAENIFWLGTLGIAMCGISIYSQPYLSICIMCELTTHSSIKTLLCLSLTCFCICKIIGVMLGSWIQSLTPEPTDFNTYLVIFLLIPISVLQLVCGLCIEESPRALIQANLTKAQQLLRKIISWNGLESERVLSKIDDYYLVKRINVQKHRYFSFYKYGQFGLAQYCVFIVMLLLGIISQYPDYVLSGVGLLESGEVQEIWISTFQLIGLAGTSFFIKFSRRKLACILNAGIVAVLSTILFFVARDSLQKNLVIVGLSAAFSISHYTFLIYNTIEMYPHSVRTIGLGLAFSLYYFGCFLIKLYQFLEPTESQLLELFMLDSLIIWMHTGGLRETMGKGFSYELQEIQDGEQFDQF